MLMAPPATGMLSGEGGAQAISSRAQDALERCHAGFDSPAPQTYIPALPDASSKPSPARGLDTEGSGPGFHLTLKAANCVSSHG